MVSEREVSGCLDLVDAAILGKFTFISALEISLQVWQCLASSNDRNQYEGGAIDKGEFGAKLVLEILTILT